MNTDHLAEKVLLYAMQNTNLDFLNCTGLPYIPYVLQATKQLKTNKKNYYLKQCTQLTDTGNRRGKYTTQHNIT